MNRKIVTILSFIFIGAAIVIAVFPFISNSLNKHEINKEIEAFEYQLDNPIYDNITYNDALKQGMIDSEGYLINNDNERKSDFPVIFQADIDRLKNDSEEYNQIVSDNQFDLLIDSNSYSQPYFNLSEYGISNGIYGYISSDVINLKLPIYLGANDYNMSNGAAHLTYTSLPTSGNNTNVVLAGHTGYIGKIFFDYLNKLEIDDIVTIQNYWETMTYKVVDLKINKSYEIADIFIQKNKNLLTLITCVYNGSGGYDRLCVICERT